MEERALSRSWHWFNRSSVAVIDAPAGRLHDDERFDRLAQVLDHLPPGPFSREAFLAHAIGLNAITNASDIDLILDRLAELELIHRFGARVDTWVVRSPAPH